MCESESRDMRVSARAFTYQELLELRVCMHASSSMEIQRASACVSTCQGLCCKSACVFSGEGCASIMMYVHLCVEVNQELSVYLHLRAHVESLASTYT